VDVKLGNRPGFVPKQQRGVAGRLSIEQYFRWAQRSSLSNIAIGDGDSL
jgi:hypothetical protein